MFSLIAVLTIVTLLIYRRLWRKHYPSAPPGPVGLPWIGYIPFLGSQPYLTFTELAKKYGNIFSLKLGKYDVVVLNDYEILKETWKDDAFCGRPNLDMLMLWSGVGTEERHGIIINEGSGWQEQRRFILRHLREFGFGKKSMEGLIQDEVEQLIDGFKRDLGKPTQLHRRFDLAVVNSLWTLISGQRFDQNDARLNALLDTISGCFLEADITGILLFLPEISQMFPGLSGWKHLTECATSQVQFMQNQVCQHQKTYSQGSLRDLIDVYLNEIRKSKDPSSSFYKEKGERNLAVSLVDLFVAGAETTATTLTWAFLYLLRNPQVLARVQAEIDREIGRKRRPCLQDRDRLIYTHATILEVLRTSTVLPFGALHAIREDTMYRGYLLKKGTVIMGNLHAVLHDPQYWNNPQEFLPERFLDPTESSLRKDDAFVAFGIGKRSCIGESLAKDQVFLILTSLLQTFDISNEPGVVLQTEPKATGVIRHPKPFNVILADRTEPQKCEN